MITILSATHLKAFNIARVTYRNAHEITVGGRLLTGNIIWIIRPIKARAYTVRAFETSNRALLFIRDYQQLRLSSDMLSSNLNMSSDIKRISLTTRWHSRGIDLNIRSAAGHSSSRTLNLNHTNHGIRYSLRRICPGSGTNGPDPGRGTRACSWASRTDHRPLSPLKNLKTVSFLVDIRLSV